MGRPKDIDWELIEREYRAGQLSVREISRASGVSHTAINKRARKEGWGRALADRVRENVKERLIRDAVSTGVSKTVSTPDARRQEKLLIEAAGERGYNVARQHQQSLGRAARLTEKLLDELETSTEQQEEIEDAIAEETAKDEKPTRRNQMLKAVSLPTRAQTMTALSVALKNLIPHERRAYNLDDPGQAEDGEQPRTKIVFVPPKDQGGAPLVRKLDADVDRGE